VKRGWSVILTFNIWVKKLFGNIRKLFGNVEMLKNNFFFQIFWKPRTMKKLELDKTIQIADGELNSIIYLKNI